MNTIVFGATGGVGGAVVQDLQKRGHKVLIAGRNQRKLDELHQQTGFPTMPMARGEEGVMAAFEFAKTQAGFGRIDGVVSCVGTFPTGKLNEMSLPEAVRDIAANAEIALAILKGARLHLTQGGGVVLLSSVITHRGAPRHTTIGAAKGMVEGAMRSAAAELARSGIRVNALALGVTKTNPTKHIWGVEGAESRFAHLYPLGFNEPADVAETVAFLLTARGITGQTLIMDGGFSVFPG